MPRLTNNEYLKQRTHLRRLWFDQPGGAMPWLTGMEQWDLHGFFAPSENLTDAHALAHRATISKEQPSLPQRAGRAYTKLLAIKGRLKALPPRAAVIRGGKRANRRAKDLNIQAIGLVRPTPDYERLARVLLEIAENDAKKADQEAA